MASKKPTLYFITTELPWPATSGGRIKSFRFLTFLSDHYEVNLACAHGANDGKTLTAFREASGVTSVQVFGELKKRTAFNWFLAIAQFPTLNCFRVYSKKMETVMRWGIEQSDVTIVDHLEMLEMIPERLVPKVIYHSHNAEFKLWADYARLAENPIKKWLLEWEADRVKVFERWAIKRAKFTFAAPNDSAAILENSDISKDKFRLTYHLGNEALLDKAPINFDGNKPKIFFGGTLSWMPNRDGISWFMRQVWPGIKSKAADAELVICGAGADKDLVTIMRHTEGVKYLGFVDNLSTEMEKCRCAIVPLRFGSGMKIKTFDAMYRGLPVVSSPAGVEGMKINDSEAIVCGSVSDWEAGVLKLVTDAAVASQMAAAARKLVSDEYTYPKIFGEMLSNIKQS